MSRDWHWLLALALICFFLAAVSWPYYRRRGIHPPWPFEINLVAFGLFLWLLQVSLESGVFN